MTDIKLYSSDYVLFDKDKQALVEDLDIIYSYSTVIDLLQDRSENPLTSNKSWSFVSMTELPKKLQDMYKKNLGVKL